MRRSPRMAFPRLSSCWLVPICLTLACASGRPGDARPGDARSGAARSGAARSGASRSGDIHPGDSRPSDIHPGDSRPGNTPDTHPADLRPADAAAHIDLARLERIDVLVQEAIARHQLPGAVVLVGYRDTVPYFKAFGHRSLVPSLELMTPDTIFDLASLTKVVATAPSMMKLLEQGMLRLEDPVAKYIPEFAGRGKEGITLRHLLTHTSGLRPDLDLDVPWQGTAEAMARACNELPAAKPGQRFQYSDINFLLLGEVVARISGMPLEAFSRKYIFEPLGMRETTFNPPSSWRPRVAPTMPDTDLAGGAAGKSAGGVAGGEPLRGLVHDPTARRMNGVAGHAGLFGTAADLSRFCRMMLEHGALEGVRILSPLAVARMTSRATPCGLEAVRGLGWDMDSSLSANRGELFPGSSFGHTGFTGPSLWIDPSTGVYVIFLASRLHPDGAGDVRALRSQVATVVAGAILDPPLEAPACPPAEESARREAGLEAPVLEVRSGLDVLRESAFEQLRGRRVGLLTNQTGRTRDGQSVIDLLHSAPGVRLVALFSPEHGIRGDVDERVSSARDLRTGLPVFSLYSATRRPTDQMLHGIDTLVIDLQDVGARFYTYATTMAYMLEAAARHHIAVVVLDRPNPITGSRVEGPMLDAELEGFTGYLPMPVRHGLTLGELARLFNAQIGRSEHQAKGHKEEQGGNSADLTVIPVQGWHRPAWFDETGLPWTAPSPNMRNVIAATLYPGIGGIEGTRVSVGRGTDSPFEQLGAPWIDAVQLSNALNRRGLAGVRFYPVSFTPTSGRFARELCHGVFILITDRNRLEPVRLGLEIASMLHGLYPASYRLDANGEPLLGSRDTQARVLAGEDPARIAASWKVGEEGWRQAAAPYLLYGGWGSEGER